MKIHRIEENIAIGENGEILGYVAPPQPKDAQEALLWHYGGEKGGVMKLVFHPKRMTEKQVCREILNITKRPVSMKTIYARLHEKFEQAIPFVKDEKTGFYARVVSDALNFLMALGYLRRTRAGRYWNTA